MQRFKFLCVMVILALMLSLLPHQVQPVTAASPTVFINEIHYDNAGADEGEAVEVAGPAGTDLTDWSIVLYNGNGGASYGTAALSGSIPDLGNGFGVVFVDTPGLQNGSPDGLALVDNTDAVIQFLSYEGAFAATNGPANGMTSVDILVSETGSEPIGQSLQLIGTGDTYSEFTWSGPSAATFGEFNTDQTFLNGNDPSGIGLADPASVLPGGDTLLTVAVTSGSNPTSTGLAVVADLTAIGGSAAQSFFDDGSNGDVTADDNTFSFLATVLAGTTPASLSLPATISDTQARSASADIALEVLPVVQITALSLQQSVDQVAWSPVNGNMFTGFKVSLNSTVPFYYLDVAGLTTNRPLSEDYFPFYLDETQVPDGFYDYWAGKGVDDNALVGTWQETMWQIINGNLPMFYLKVSASAPTYMLVDGLQYAVDPSTDQLLQVPGDYPRGTYFFDGVIEDQIGSSSAITVGMNFSTLPDITTLTLQQAVDPTSDWIPVSGSWNTGFAVALDAGRPFYFLDVADFVVDPSLETGYHPFTLDVTSVPANFYDYWAGKGVTASASGTWEPTMWQIINGNLPMFYLKVSDTAPTYMLVDGLLHALNPAAVDEILRISGDYPAGTYQFNGDLNIDGQDANSNLPVSITFSVNAPIQITIPDIVHVYEGVGGSSPVAAMDPDGTAVAATITGGAMAGIELQNVVPAATLGGSLTATLAVSDTVLAGTYDVEITFTNNDPFPQSNVAVVQVIVYPEVCPAPSPTYPLQTNIGVVQGEGLTPDVTGNVTIKGTITDRSLNGEPGTQYGFYIQDAGDGNSLTSDGMFVYTSSSNQQGVSLPIGSPVMVSGVVSDYNNGTQLTPVASGVVPCGIAATITPVTVNLPADSDPTNLLEKYENMLVNLPQTFTIDQNYFQGRYGQMTVSPDGRLYNPTDGNFPGTFAELTAANNARMLVLDDNNYIQNPSVTPYLSIGDYPYTDNIFDPTRAGDLIEGMTGILDQGATNSYAGPYSPWYRLQPTVWPTITRGSNPRTSAPADPGGNVKVAGFNLYNYFTTLDMAPYRSTYPYDGSANTPRGADTEAEFARQKAKTVMAIINLGADVTGVIELENNGATSIDDLVNGPNGLNAVAGAGIYNYVIDTLPQPNGDPDGPDYIKAGIIYKPDVVTPLGDSVWSDAAIFDRPPLAQTFTVNGNDAIFSVVVNHFKSKGSCPSSGDVDLGQGCWNERRVAQAAELLNFINTTLLPVDPDVVAVGDYNSYGSEDPIITLTDGGLVNEMLNVPAEDRYTYVFDGAAGYLDHMLVTSSVDNSISGISVWHINADEFLAHRLQHGI